MAIRTYLAMTAAEIAQHSISPEYFAWMGCPFSHTGFLPEQLPEGSVLVLTDEIPPVSPFRDDIPDALRKMLFRSSCRCVILDFQHPGSQEALLFAKCLLKELPCPVAVSDFYAETLDCPVFLSPLPLHIRLTDHISPWQGREIWLDFSREGERITLTEQGCSISPLPHFPGLTHGHRENHLHCHYAVSLTDTSAEFTLWRTSADMEDLRKEVESCGITAMVGLHQELSGLFSF